MWLPPALWRSGSWETAENKVERPGGQWGWPPWNGKYGNYRVESRTIVENPSFNSRFSGCSFSCSSATFGNRIAAGGTEEDADFTGAAPSCSLGIVKLHPAKQYLRDNPDVAEKLDADIRRDFYKLMSNQSKIAARAAGRPVDVSADDFDDEDDDQ